MTRPVVAIISNSLTPYRLHFHQRLIREQQGIEWWSLFTHDISNAPWSIEDAGEIRPIQFGKGERSSDQSKPLRALHEFRKGGRIIQWLQEHHVAAVILLGYNDLGRLRVLRWCHRHQIPCFLFGDSNIRGDQAIGCKARIKQWLLPRILRRCSGVLSCGSLGRLYFRKYGVPDDRIFYMPYEPDYQMIQGLPDSTIQESISRLQLNTSTNYILYCGRLAPEKRVDVLIDAFCSVAADRPDWMLVIVGDGPLRAKLEQQVPPGLQERVRWLGFLNDPATIAAIQRAARILVLPSDFEPWGVVINEAVAADCAVVATAAVGAAAELVRDNVNGFIIPCGDGLQLATAILSTSAPQKLADFREASAHVLKDWRRLGDPVNGLMQALQSVRISPQSGVWGGPMGHAE